LATRLKNNIRQLREERKWSRRELVEKVGGTQQWLYLLEAGEIRLMPKHIAAFCNVFGVTPDALAAPAKTGKKKGEVPAAYVDIVAEAVIDAAVAKAQLDGKKAQALRQQLRYSAMKAKQGIKLA